METFFRYTLTGLMCTVAGMQFVQVITRYVLEVPMMGLEEMAIYPTLWLYVMGSINASREDTQIKANVLEIFLHTERARHILQVIAETLSLVIALWLTWWAWDYFRYALRVQKETPTLYLPTIWYECALIVGLVFMALYIVIHLVRNVRRLASGEYGTQHPADEELPITPEVAAFDIYASNGNGERRHG